MKDKKASLKGRAFLKKELRPYRGSIIFLAALSVMATLCQLAFALLVRNLINSAADENRRGLLIFAVILLCILLAKIVLRTLLNYLSERERARMTKRLQKKFFSRIIRSDYAKISAYHSGELINRLTTDIREIVIDSVGLMQAVAGMIMQCAGAVVALVTIDWKFTVIYILGGLLICCISFLFRGIIKKNQRDYLKAEDLSRSFMQESISSVLTLKAYCAEGRIDEKSDAFLSRSYERRMTKNRLRSLIGLLFSFLTNIGMIFAVVWCGLSIYRGSEDYGAILSIILLLMQLQQPLSQFSGIMPVIYSRLASGERLAEIEEISPELPDREDAGKVYEKLESIEIDNISFGYSAEKVFDLASGTINKGEIVCITGASGTGKSTLFRLLLCVYRAEGGSLRLSLDDGKKLGLTDAYRKLFAYVPQGNFLFAGTIRENLLFFSEDKGKDLEEKLNEALKTVCADGFVGELPDGADTELSERGGGLSEGQLQRLAIARAVLSERPVLLLDEATSALDVETEAKILENIAALKNRTCIIVTHRPAALKIADRVLCIEKGKINAVAKPSGDMD